MSNKKLTAAVVTGVVTIAAGASTYAVARYYAGGYGPESCGKNKCIAHLKTADVVKALQSKGHQCHPDKYPDMICTLTIGDVEYRADLDEVAGRLSNINVSVSSFDRNRKLNQSPGVLAYFKWFSELPFADDPSIASDIQKWITVKLAERKESTGTIAEYKYRVKANRSSSDVSLSIETYGL